MMKGTTSRTESAPLGPSDDGHVTIRTTAVAVVRRWRTGVGVCMCWTCVSRLGRRILIPPPARLGAALAAATVVLAVTKKPWKVLKIVATKNVGTVSATAAANLVHVS
jgi:hypothetical protein